MNNEAGSGRTAAATAPSRPRKSATVQRDVTTSFSAGENKLRGVTVTLFVVAAALMLWELYAIARNNQVTVSDILRAGTYVHCVRCMCANCCCTTGNVCACACVCVQQTMSRAVCWH